MGPIVRRLFERRNIALSNSGHLQYNVGVPYPQPITAYFSSNVKVFASRADAQAWYKGKTGQDLPAYDPQRPYQQWAELRPKLDVFVTDEDGYACNFIGQDFKNNGYWRWSVDTVPYAQACVPNMSDLGVPLSEQYLIPLRRLGPTPDGGLEVLASSPFGVGVVDSLHLDSIGLYNVPPDVLQQIQDGTYQTPGV